MRMSLSIRTAPEPSEDQLKQHFSQYKTFFPNEITDENTYGFGYKQPDRVSLEYIAVKLDDVRQNHRGPHAG